MPVRGITCAMVGLIQSLQAHDQAGAVSMILANSLARCNQLYRRCRQGAFPHESITPTPRQTPPNPPIPWTSNQASQPNPISPSAPCIPEPNPTPNNPSRPKQPASIGKQKFLKSDDFEFRIPWLPSLKFNRESKRGHNSDRRSLQIPKTQKFTNQLRRLRTSHFSAKGRGN